MKLDVEIINPSVIQEIDKVVCKLYLKGSLDSNNVYKLDYILNSLIEGGVNRIVLDVEKLQYMDSTAIAAIIQLVKKIRSKKGDAVFTRCNKKILKIIGPVNLESFIKFFSTGEEGISFLETAVQ